VSLACAAAGFLLGSMPFSLWMGRLFLGVDVRKYGDGNPGATSAWRAGGWRLGVPALLLDYLKGALPVAFSYFIAGIGGWSLVPVALAPVLGSAFSPFLRFRGGKSVAVSFGIWTGLTLGHAPILLGLLLGLFAAVQSADAWAVLFAGLGLLLHLLLIRGGPVLPLVCAGNTAILLCTHRRELAQPIRPRSWLLRLFGGVD
jgi:glycerol-3-phosphate acyltransferase PlsY